MCRDSLLGYSQVIAVTFAIAPYYVADISAIPLTDLWFKFYIGSDGGFLAIPPVAVHAVADLLSRNGIEYPLLPDEGAVLGIASGDCVCRVLFVSKAYGPNVNDYRHKN